MRIFGGVRKILENFGGVRKIFEKFGGVRNFSENFGGVRKFFENFGGVRKIFRYASYTFFLLYQSGCWYPISKFFSTSVQMIS